mmetsp:Transcript_99864/g.305230  ORF Transcript_99864/g.305230 Transcript_99864/m.305230 type:complete len:202 (-) Transcript_99864:761-1366(-)
MHFRNCEHPRTASVAMQILGEAAPPPRGHARLPVRYQAHARLAGLPGARVLFVKHQRARKRGVRLLVQAAAELRNAVSHVGLRVIGLLLHGQTTVSERRLPHFEPRERRGTVGVQDRPHHRGCVVFLAVQLRQGQRDEPRGVVSDGAPPLPRPGGLVAPLLVLVRGLLSLRPRRGLRRGEALHVRGARLAAHGLEPSVGRL